ncbi:diguanylate cyclase [Massilia yuzhufengensis]|uniref:Diguanylate cyclase (GGDEF) domain-containing protein n=1 Tax=Massilia yuzhufengensis TaxID=1164594 RepID=A0A1I1DRV1_9BURK|nr:diguanylate cyclase [Massilia yuzhufengensis]SFB77725.1 diguanylate cyclase (GGDEF) domain-containing protein [Massilia yuzhufengensis]
MVAVLAQRVASLRPRRRLQLAGLAVLVLALLLAFFYIRSEAADPEIRNDVLLNLRELEKLDAEWDANILRAHIGRAPATAALTTQLPRMRELTTRLGEAVTATSGAPVRTAYSLLRDAMQRKELLAVQFGRHNPPLREALVYLPPAVADLKTELGGIEGALAPARLVVRLDASLNALLTEILRYNVTPNPPLAARIDEILGDIAAQQIAFSPAVVEKMDALIKTSRVILVKRPLENRLEAHIAATATGAALDRLGREFDRAFDTELAVRERYRGYLFGYSAFLLLLLAYAGMRLRRSYRIIGEVNHRLQAANENLEHRVAERTAELEAQSKQLERLAQHDSLTGLINYRQLTRLLERALARANRRDSVVVIMFIDLDGFKAVNDTYGHATGDLVLQMVARRVQEKLRAEDALARLGGDEFVIMLEEVASREGALRVAQLALDQIRSVTEADGNPVTISASIGISSARGHLGAARGSAALLAEADKAMYDAKSSGKGGFVVSPSAQWLAPGQGGAH